jgi:hypothetical protein
MEPKNSTYTDLSMAFKRVSIRELIPLISPYSYMCLGKTALPTRDHEPATQIKRWAFSCTNYTSRTERVNYCSFFNVIEFSRTFPSFRVVLVFSVFTVKVSNPDI